MSIPTGLSKNVELIDPSNTASIDAIHPNVKLPVVARFSFTQGTLRTLRYSGVSRDLGAYLQLTLDPPMD